MQHMRLRAWQVRPEVLATLSRPHSVIFRMRCLGLMAQRTAEQSEMCRR